MPTSVNPLPVIIVTSALQHWRGWLRNTAGPTADRRLAGQPPVADWRANRRLAGQPPIAGRRLPGQTPTARPTADRRAKRRSPVADCQAKRRSPVADCQARRRLPGQPPIAGPNAGPSGEHRVVSPYGLHS